MVLITSHTWISSDGNGELYEEMVEHKTKPQIGRWSSFFHKLDEYNELSVICHIAFQHKHKPDDWFVSVKLWRNDSSVKNTYKKKIGKQEQDREKGTSRIFTSYNYYK